MHQKAAGRVSPARPHHNLAVARATPRAVSGTSMTTMAASPKASLASAKYAKELKDACDAVRLASSLCQVVQRQLGEAEKQAKQDSSPVTVADYGAQALVAWSLARASPGVKLSMVAEEDSESLRSAEGRPMLLRIAELVNDVLVAAYPGNKLSPEQIIELIDLGSSPGGKAGRHWVLDPIDGTRGFVDRRQYSVCLGMLQDGEVELGVLGCPNLPRAQVTDEVGQSGSAERADPAAVGCLFLAHRGCGAHVARLWQDRGADWAAGLAPISVSDSADGSGARFMESFESRHSNHEMTAAVAKAVGVTLPPLRMDSQVKYGLLSRGDASIFMRFPPPTYKEKIWDHCAGFVIVEEAGGRVTDAAGRRLDFSEGRYLALDRGIVAAPPALHASLIAAIKEL